MERKAELYRAVSEARDFDINDPALRGNVDTEYETFALMRRNLPVARSERAQEWLFFDYQDCKYAFQHPEIFSNAFTKLQVPLIPQEIDPPAQREYRRLLDPLFSPQVMAPLEPEIRLHANRLLDGLLAKREFDFVEAFAVPFPSIIFARFVGWPLEDLPQLMTWNRSILHADSTAVADELGAVERDPTGKPTEEAALRIQRETASAVVAYINDLLARRRTQPGNDVLSRMLEARYEGQRLLTNDELLYAAYLFFLAGLDTVTSTLSMIVFDFARHPDRRRRFVESMDDPDRLTSAVEELMRFHSIVEPNRRVARDCSYRGIELRAGDHVHLISPSANRDECAFKEAEELDFERQPNPHLGFGVGPHRCLGIHLARRELRIGLEELHRRMPNYAIAPGTEASIYTGGMRGLHTLPLVLEPGGEVP